MILTNYFADDSRRYWNAHMRVYKKSINGTPFEIVKDILDDTKPCISQRCALKILVLLFFLVWLIFFVFSVLNFD